MNAVKDILDAIEALSTAARLAADKPAFVSDFDDIIDRLEVAEEHIARVRNEAATAKALWVEKEEKDERQFAAAIARRKAEPAPPNMQNWVKEMFGYKS